MICNTPHAFWRNNLTHITFSQSGHTEACKTSDFFLLLILLLSSPPSLTNLRFPHSTSMNTSLSKSSKFPLPSLSIPEKLIPPNSSSQRFLKGCLLDNQKGGCQSIISVNSRQQIDKINQNKDYWCQCSSACIAVYQL